MPEEGNGFYLQKLPYSPFTLILRCPTNCKKCDNGVSCTQCYRKFEWKPETKICEKSDKPGQDFEPTEPLGKCTRFQCEKQQCEDSILYKEKQVCEKCERIQIYEFQDNCYQKCPESTFSEENSFECKQCSVQNCARCENEKNDCLECKLGFTKKVNKNTGEVECVQACKEGEYEDEKSGECKQCKVENCAICTQNSQGKECQKCISNQVLFENKCLPKCPSGTYYDKEQQTCTKCTIDNCIKCDNSENQCQKCQQGFILNENLCVQDCPKGTFKNGEVCENCDESCASCENSKDRCTECQQGQFLYKQEQKCLRQCPSSHFGNVENGLCEECGVQNCLNCENKESCSKCKGKLFVYDNQCYENCPIGTYPDEINQKCEKCKGENCQKCNSQGDCIECSKDYYLTEEKNECLSEQQCVNSSGFANKETNLCEKCEDFCENCQNNREICSKCQKNYKLSEGKCISQCPEGSYYDEIKQQCEKCSQNCEICSQKDKCIHCKPGFFHYEDSLECGASCGKGYYQNEEKKICEKCPQNCENCSENKNKCENCQEGYIISIDGYKCVSQCEEGQYRDSKDNQCKYCGFQCKKCENSEICQLCQNEYFLLNDSECVDQENCGQGKFADQETNKCENCQENCLKCENKNECKQCENSFVKFEGKCFENCPESTYLDQDQNICLRCSENCLECENGENCQKCLENFFLNQESVCVEQCPEGQFGDKSDFKCKNCIENCRNCENQEGCLQCNEEFYLNDSSLCVQDCGEGKFGDKQSQKCENCRENCSVCQNYDQCSLCKENYFVQKDSEFECVTGDQCIIGSFADSESGKCENCIQDCQKCDKKDSCLVCEQGFELNEDQICVRSQDCGPNCLDCQENNQCKECENGYFLSKFRCVETCPTGQFGDLSQKSCENCVENCDICENKITCQKCNSQYVVNDKQQCILRCEIGEYYEEQNNSEGKCVKCPLACKRCKEHGDCLECSNPDHHLLDHQIIGGKFIKKCFECPDDYCYDHLTQKCYKSYECPRSKNNKKQVCTKQNRYCVEVGLDGDGMAPIHFHLKNIDNIYSSVVSQKRNVTLPESQIKSKLCANLESESHQAFVELYDQELQCSFSHVDFEKYNKTVNKISDTEILNEYVNTYTWLIMFEISDTLLDHEGFEMKDIPQIIEKAISIHQDENNIFKQPKSVYFVFLASKQIYEYYQKNIVDKDNLDYTVLEKHQNMVVDLRRQSNYEGIEELKQQLFINSPDENNQIYKTQNGVIYTFTFWMTQLKFKSDSYQFKSDSYQFV